MTRLINCGWKFLFFILWCVSLNSVARDHKSRYEIPPEGGSKGAL